MQRGIVRTGLGLFVGLTLAVTGCAAPVEEDPSLALAASTEALEEESFRFEMTAGELLSASGAVDPAADAGSVAMSLAFGGMSADVEVVVLGTEMWANVGELGGLLGVGTSWLHIDQSRLGEGGFAGVEPDELDLVGAAELLKGLGTVEQVDEHTFRGEIDLARGASTVFADELLKALGEESVTLEFTATVDDEGRLTRLVVDLPQSPQVPAEQLELRYFDFGAPVEVSPPPADQVTELPETFYDMFS